MKGGYQMNKLFRIGIPALAVLLLAISIFGFSGVVSADNTLPQQTGACPYFDNNGNYYNGTSRSIYMMGSTYGGYQSGRMASGGYGVYQGRNMMGR